MKYTQVSLLLLTLIGACNPKGNEEPDTPAVPPPATLSYSIVNTFPHDTASFTQGLIVYNGKLYEGTGNYGRSKLRQVDLSTGKGVREIDLDKQYFGEGITILRDTVYQLTWREKKVFVYTLDGFRKIREYNVDFEGWGITHNGTQLIVSTGGSDLLFFDPSTFKLVKTQTVLESGSPSFNLNELEYIDGYVYANQYEYPYILKIDPATGVVVAKADLSPTWNRIRQLHPGADVPNGIAYDTAGRKMYITGKLWPELYEVRLGQ